MTRKSKEARLAEIRAATTLARSGQVISLLKFGIGFAFLAFATIQIEQMIEVLAGKETIADIAFAGRFFAHVGISDALAWLLGGGAAATALRYKHLLKRTRKEMGDRITQLESRLDKRRSSSRLAPTGETNPEDK